MVSDGEERQRECCGVGVQLLRVVVEDECLEGQWLVMASRAGPRPG